MKFYGSIGYCKTEQTSPGIWEEKVLERICIGEVTKNWNRKYSSGDTINGNLTSSNQVSILADPYALSNFQNIRYVSWNGQKWNVTNVEIQHPRMILDLGDRYNEEENQEDE